MNSFKRRLSNWAFATGTLICLVLVAGAWWGIRPILAPPPLPTATLRPVNPPAGVNPVAVNQQSDTTPKPTQNILVIEQVETLIPSPTNTSAATATPTALPPTPTRTASPTPAASPTGTPTMTPSATPDAGPEELELGKSAGGRPISAVRFGTGARVIMLIGGFHAGFAPSTVDLAEQAIAYFRQNPTEIPRTATLLIVRNANPDSPYAPGEVTGRLNGRRVDPNRNWDCNWRTDAVWSRNPVSGGTEPFSEPEVQALLTYIESQQVVAVIFWEARATGGLASPGGCGESSLVSVPLATAYGRAAGYKIGDFEAIANYSLTGDGTNWLDSQQIPAISVLLPSYTQYNWPDHLAGIRAVLRSYGQ